MKKRILLALVLFLIALPMQAAVDVRMQGSIYAEIASEPGDVLRAGTRIQLYSELASSGFTAGKVRLIGLNQKVGDLNTFDSGSYFLLDNLINWVEVQLRGNLFPQGPPVLVSIGNVEVDYSPYVISLKDDLLNCYHTSYLNRRGVTLRELKVGGLEGSGFALWGFGDPSKNAVGGKLSRTVGPTKFSGIIVDYRHRAPDSERKILESFANNQQLVSELGWEQIKSLELERQVGVLGSFHILIANQNRKVYNRVDNNNVESIQHDSILQKYQWELPITDETNFVIGYRDFPSDFDPIFRDRTSEFDSHKGYYLGYNPIDMYQDRVGYYSEISTQKDSFKLGIRIEDYRDHQVWPANYKTTGFALIGQVFAYQVDVFSQLEQKISWFNTGIRNTSTKGFTRFILMRPLAFGRTPMLTGLEIRRQSDVAGIHNSGTLFVRYKKSDYLTVDAGVVQAFSKGVTGGSFWGLKYKAPNGLELQYRNTYPTIVSEGKLCYDPDYRLHEEGSIFKLSVNTTF